MPVPMIAGIKRVTQYVNGNQFAVAESMPRGLVGAPAALVANTAYLYKVRFPKVMTPTTMSWYVGAAAGTIDAGIYSSADSGVTLTRLATTATAGSTTPITVAGANVVQAAALATSVTVSPDTDYWLALVASTATTLTVGRVGVQSGIMFSDYRGSALALGGGVVVLPASITGHSAISNLVWVQAS